MRKGPTDIQLDIEALDEDGLGVGHWVLPKAPDETREVRVRNALPGEEVEARILKRRRGKRYADGLAVLDRSAAARVPSPCENFPRCGGCSLMHMRYDTQLQFKQNLLSSALDVAQVTAEKMRPVTTSGQLLYRRKARLGVRKVGEQVMVGFRESFANRVVDMRHCLTLTPRLAALIEPLRVLIADMSIADQIPQIEVAEADSSHSDRTVCLIFRHLAPFSTEDLSALAIFEATHSVSVALQSKGYDTVVTLGGDPPPLLGYDLPAEGVRVQFDPRQFTQVNNRMNEALVRVALSYLRPDASLHVLDLFCGIGNFSLPLARKGAAVTGFEFDSTAIERAAANAVLNGLADRAEFQVVDLYDEQTTLPEADAWLLDPPRSGAGANLERWLAAPGAQRLTQVVYVSCSPTSFARDASTLIKAGFTLREAGAYDMFPQTTHVETVGHFTRG